MEYWSPGVLMIRMEVGESDTGEMVPAKSRIQVQLRSREDRQNDGRTESSNQDRTWVTPITPSKA